MQSLFVYNVFNVYFGLKECGYSLSGKANHIKLTPHIKTKSEINILPDKFPSHITQRILGSFELDDEKEKETKKRKKEAKKKSILFEAPKVVFQKSDRINRNVNEKLFPLCLIEKLYQYSDEFPALWYLLGKSKTFSANLSQFFRTITFRPNFIVAALLLTKESLAGFLADQRYMLKLFSHLHANNSQTIQAQFLWYINNEITREKHDRGYGEAPKLFNPQWNLSFSEYYLESTPPSKEIRGMKWIHHLSNYLTDHKLKGQPHTVRYA